jgi:outer membrane receptor for Fe3+-dicitrate
MQQRKPPTPDGSGLSEEMNMTNRLQTAIDAATAKHQAGADVADVVAAAHTVLSASGEFGKSLDRSVRRVVRQVTGLELQPGQGHGSRRADGTISYRG